MSKSLRQCTKTESIKSYEHSLSDFSSEFVLFYFQSWGQGLEKRIEMLNKAVALAGIKAEFFQTLEFTGWKGKNQEEIEKARNMRHELDESFPIGSFEAEQCAVINIKERRWINL